MPTFWVPGLPSPPGKKVSQSSVEVPDSGFRYFFPIPNCILVCPIVEDFDDFCKGVPGEEGVPEFF